MTACAASTQAIGEASEIIRYGDADIMLAGGAHSMIHPLGMTGFIRLTAMSDERDNPTKASRPFDLTRGGFVMGEGAGILILEELEHALKRGATPLAELAGYGIVGRRPSASRTFSPMARGRRSACGRRASRRGSIRTNATSTAAPAVHYISAHGTGTQENDRIETKAVKAVFGDLAPKVPSRASRACWGT